MKKILSIALVALLAVSTAFAADFSGSAAIKFGYDFETKDWGFSNPTSKKIDITTEFKSGSVENAGEGAIYAGIKASFKVNFVAKQGTNSDFVGIQIPANGGASISEAYITNGNWTVSILGAAGAPDFAKSYYKVGSNNVTYKSAATAAPGFKATVNGYTAAFGIKGNTDKETIDWSAYVATPEYTLAEDLTASFAAAASDDTELAGSAKFDYGTLASVAADFGYSTSAKKFDFDLAATFDYAPVTVNAYYWYGSKILAAKAVADLDPLTLTVDTRDILDKINITVTADYEVDEALSVSATGGYTVKDKTWTVGGSATYEVTDFTAKAGATYNWTSKDVQQLYANASIESTTLVPGATLKLAYGPKKSGSTVVTNLLNKAYGAVDASCTISF